VKSFFNEPDHFSFKDVLAIAFAGAFLFFSYKALTSKDALVLVQTLVPLIGIILGGYFVQESAAQWLNKSNNVQPSQPQQPQQPTPVVTRPEVERGERGV
jgi:ABC-type enterochelin transport system permease subunit